MPKLTPKEIITMLEAGVAKGNELGIPQVMAIVDEGGNL